MVDSTFTQQVLLPGNPTTGLHAATKQYVDGVLGNSGPTPAGAVLPFASSTVPSGWLLCYGQAVSRTTYAALFAAIGTSYGAGDGSTTFNLPDLRGRAVAGLDNMGGSDAARLDWVNTLGTAGGEQKHTMTLAELVAHAHTTDSPVNFAGSGALQGTQAVAKGTTGSTGSTTPFNVMQPTMLMNWIISIGTTATSWTAPTLTNSWVNNGGGYQDAGYIKDAMGFVHLKGLVKSGTANTAIFTLPTGFRPTARCYNIQIAGAGFAAILIETTGVVQVGTYIASGSNAYVGLDGITFGTF